MRNDSILHRLNLFYVEFLDQIIYFIIYSDEELIEEEEEEEEEEEDNDNVCAVCSAGGMLVCCDTCPLVYHLDCAIPPLKKVPRGKWQCQLCTGGTTKGKIKLPKCKETLL